VSGQHTHANGETHHHPEPQSTAAIRTKAIESLLIEKGLLSSDVVDTVVSTYENDIGPMIGAKIVARAWTDPAFKQRLLADATAAIEELGYKGNHMLIVENTPTVHNVVCCTLCSCYPWAVLGLPPSWYKSFEYRSRIVIEPRAVLKEFGLDVDDSVEIRVWDSSAEMRYLVIPERPKGTEHLSEDELAKLVSRDAMIGTAAAASPAGVV
jgi:nitrile hydratase subunit alpha